MNIEGENVPTRVGYPLKETSELHAMLTCPSNITEQCSYNNLSIPPTISSFSPFNVTQCPSEHQKCYDSLRTSEHAAASLESETQTQCNSSHQCWSKRISKLTASTFGDTSWKSVINSFLKGFVKDKDTSGSLRNVPEPLKLVPCSPNPQLMKRLLVRQRTTHMGLLKLNAPTNTEMSHLIG